MLKKYNWMLPKYDENEIAELSRKAGIESILAKVFLSRGVRDASEIKQFINPSLKNLHDPFLMTDMIKAVDRIFKAKANRESVTVYSDYDVDGVSSAAMLMDFLSYIDLTPMLYIPSRETEGYGISSLGVETIKSWGSSLVITADCGISAENEIAELTGAGIDVIVTDHHECPDRLPDAYAILNPCRKDCGYPFRELAGSGVVFKLIQALSSRTEHKDKYMDYLDLVALGTICDVVPLINENRIFAKFGLDRLNKSNREGIKALIRDSKLTVEKLEAYHVGFVLGPRLNAAGRLGNAVQSVKLLTSCDPNEASSIAKELGEANSSRQSLEKEILDSAISEIEAKGYQKDRVIIVDGEGWHHGVIGIVASRITDKYYRPCIVLSVDGDEARGSGRSVEDFNLYEALSSVEDLLSAFGGHEMAAGVSIKAGVIEAFRKKINEYAESLNEDIFIRKITADAVLSNTELNIRSAYLVKSLEPFGCGNPTPVFSAVGLRRVECRPVGNGKHCKLKLSGESIDRAVDVIAFNFTDGNLKELMENNDSVVDVLANLDINTWQGHDYFQLKLCDIRQHKASLLNIEDKSVILL
ncbi:MAG: single-stranded-DNA-specific exonuclease RecJ [Eubacteriales bacterium]|nr:single-stranded-DNA-specific exonuclease RecJ [Eubacteriales bacterium]